MADNDAILDKCACTEADEHDGGIQADQHYVSASWLNDFLFHTLRTPTLLIYPFCFLQPESFSSTPLHREVENSPELNCWGIS